MWSEICCQNGVSFNSRTAQIFVLQNIYKLAQSCKEWKDGLVWWWPKPYSAANAPSLRKDFPTVPQAQALCWADLETDVLHRGWCWDHTSLMDRIVAACPPGMLEPFLFPQEESNLPASVQKASFCVSPRHLLDAWCKKVRSKWLSNYICSCFH